MSAVLDLFLELAAILSPPGEERAVADRVLERLRAIGLEPDEDGAGAAIGSTIGNIYARLPATVEGTPIFLNAHLDTVPPTAAVVPRGAQRHRGERRADDPGGRQQGGRGRDAGRRRAGGGRRHRPRRHRAGVHAHGGGRPARRQGVRRLAAARAVRLLLRPRRADRQHRRRGAHPEDAEAQVPRPRCAFGHRPGGGPQCDRRRGARRSPTCGWAGSMPAPRPTWA